VVRSDRGNQRHRHLHHRRTPGHDPSRSALQGACRSQLFRAPVFGADGKLMAVLTFPRSIPTGSNERTH
jgi:hypothetical protein